MVGGLGCALTPTFQTWLWAHRPMALGLFLFAFAVAWLAHLLQRLAQLGLPFEDVAGDRLGRFTHASLLEVYERTPAQRLGFSLRVVSDHANAHDVGSAIAIGERLLECLTPEQLEAVLGHEIGHGRRLHSGVAGFAFVWALVAIAVVLVAAVWSEPPGWPVPLVAATLFAMSAWPLLPSLRERRLVEHVCDWAGARQAGALTMIGALLKVQEAQRTRLAERLEEVEQELRVTREARERRRLEQERIGLVALRDAPGFVSWRRYDVNGNGELDACELPLLVRGLLPWPTLHLDASPPGPHATHPRMLDRILFLVREQPELLSGASSG